LQLALFKGSPPGKVLGKTVGSLKARYRISASSHCRYNSPRRSEVDSQPHRSTSACPRSQPAAGVFSQNSRFCQQTASPTGSPPGAPGLGPPAGLEPRAELRHDLHVELIAEVAILISVVDVWVVVHLDHEHFVVPLFQVDAI